MKFTKVIKDKKEGRVFLLDEVTLEGRIESLPRIAQTFAKPAEMLRRYDYPNTRIWIEAVAFGGADSLQEVILKENDEYAKRCGLPSFMARQIRKTAVQDAPASLWTDADGIHSDIINIMSDYDLSRDEVEVVDGGISYDEETVKAKIRESLTVEVPEQVLKEAELVREIVPAICKMQDSGLNAVEVINKLCGNWLAPSQRPDLKNDLYLLSLLVERRHLPRQQVKASNPEWYFLNGGE